MHYYLGGCGGVHRENHLSAWYGLMDNVDAVGSVYVLFKKYSNVNKANYYQK